MAKKKAKPSPKAKEAAPSDRRTVVSAESLPRRPLKDTLEVAQIIRDTYAGQPTTWQEIAKAKGVSEKNPVNRYPLWSAVAYGIVLKNDDNTYSLGETGRKILAPTYEGEKEEGIRKALFTPSVLSRFYTDYNGSPIPSDELFPNVLETRYDVPRDRTAEAIEIIRDNANFANAISKREDGKEILDFSDGAFPVQRQIESHDHELVAVADELTELDADSVPVTAKEDWDTICFVVTPIGSDDSVERKHSDAILKHLLEPVLAEFKIRPIRADKIAKPGIITKQVIEFLAYSRLCVADLSFANPNAFYELGVRHAFQLSTIQIIRKGDKIPFDVSQGRTIMIDTSDPYTIMDRFDAARKELKEHVSAVMKGMEKQEDNPIHLFLPGLKVAIPK